MKRYTTTEMDAYEPPACPGCGVRVQQAWVNVQTRQDPEPVFIRGRWKCDTDGCPYGPARS